MTLRRWDCCFFNLQVARTSPINRLQSHAFLKINRHFETEWDSIDSMFCINCRTELPLQANYCPDCGTPTITHNGNNLNIAVKKTDYLSYYLEKIPCKYNKIESLSDKLVRVWNDNKAGILNDKGDEIIPCIYEEITISDSYYLLKMVINNKIGFINPNGEQIIPCEYDAIWKSDYAFIGTVINGKKGLRNGRNGQIIAKCQYDEIYEFDGEIAKVINQNKYGLIHKNGNIIVDGNILVECKYDEISEFNEDIVKVRVNNKYGYIQKNGNIIAECKYDFATRFYDQIARVVINNKWGIINHLGEIIIDCKYDWIAEFYKGRACVKKDEEWGIINKSGKEIEPCINYMTFNFEEIVVWPNLEYAKYNNLLKSKGLNDGFININRVVKKDGKTIFTHNYNSISNFQEGYSIVGIKKGIKEWKFGIINEEGKEVIPCKYDGIGSRCYIPLPQLFFSEGLIAVKLNDKWGFIDINDNIILPFVYETITNGWYYSNLNGLFFYGFICVKSQSGWGVIDKRGEITIPFNYEMIGFFSEGLYVAQLNGKWGFIDINNEVIFPFDCLERPFEYTKGLIKIKTLSGFGMINNRGEVVIRCIYENIESFSGFVQVKLNEKWGLINMENLIAFPCQYESIEGFSEVTQTTHGWSNNIRDKYHGFFEGLTKVKLNDKWGCINTKNEIIIPCYYEEISFFSEGLIAVKLNDKWGFINLKNEMKIPCKYEKIISGFKNGAASVQEIGGRILPINNKGEETPESIKAREMEESRKKIMRELGEKYNLGNCRRIWNG